MFPRILIAALVLALMLAPGQGLASGAEGRAVTVRISLYIPDRVVPEKDEIFRCARGESIERRRAYRWQCESGRSTLRVVSEESNQRKVTVVPI